MRQESLIEQWYWQKVHQLAAEGDRSQTAVKGETGRSQVTAAVSLGVLWGLASEECGPLNAVWPVGFGGECFERGAMRLRRRGTMSMQCRTHCAGGGSRDSDEGR